MLVEIEQTSIYKILSSNISNNEHNDEEVKKAINILKNNNASLDIEADHLKLAYLFPEFRIHFLSFMKKVWNEERIPKTGFKSHIKAKC